MKTFKILIVCAFFAACEKQELHFEVKPLDGDNVQIKAMPDGNTWTTTKDSVEIYIENY